MKTQAEIKAEIRCKIQAQSTDMLLSGILLLRDDFRPEADLVFVYMMSELEDRMPEDEYVAFCDMIYNA